MVSTWALITNHTKQQMGLPLGGAMLVVFLIPVYNALVPAALVLFLVLTFIRFSSAYKTSPLQITLLSLLLMYVLYAVGMLYTESASDGWTILERKLSLLVVPLYFMFFRPFNQVPVNYVLASFTAGCFLYAGFMFIRATGNYLES